MPDFKLHSKFVPTGDQPQAIESIVKGIQNGDREQSLLGVTGSGKTLEMHVHIKQFLYYAEKYGKKNEINPTG